MSAADSSGTCRKASSCGGLGERACCVGERDATSCDKGLIEIPGCGGECHCGGASLSSSSGHCAVAPSLIKLARQAELEKLFGKAAVDRIVAAVSKTVLDPRNADKWIKLSAATTAHLPLATAVISHSAEFMEKTNRDTQRYAAGIVQMGAAMAKLLEEDAARAQVGTLLVAAVEGKFEDAAAQAAAKALAAFTRKLFPAQPAAPKTAAKAASAAAAAPSAAAAKGPALDALEAVAPYLPKSFGVSIGWEAGAHIGIAGGFDGSVGFVADLDVTEKLYDIRAVYSIGVGVGVGGKAAAYDLAVAALYHVMPLRAKNTPGGSFGLAGGGGAFVTANAELVWGFLTKKEPAPGDVPPKSWLGGMPIKGGYSVLMPIPAIGVGAGIQLDPGAAVLSHLGWSATFGRPGTGGLCDASGCWDLGYSP